MANESTIDFNDIARKELTRRAFVRSATALGVGAAVFPSSGRASAQAQPLRIAFSVPGLNFPFFVHMMDLAEQHAAEIGGIEFRRLDGQQNGAPSSTKQSADLEATVAQGIDGIVISPNDANAVAPSIQAAIDAGVPVVTVDRNVTEAETLAHVGADNVRGGELQGEYLIEILADGGDVFELQGQPGATPAIDRHAGLENVLGQQEAITVSQSQTAEFSRDRAVTVMESLLTANDPPAAVVCANDDMAFGVVRVADQDGLDIPIIGFDALPEALQAIESGAMAATIEQFPGQQARTAIDILVAFLRDQQEPAEHDTFLEPILLRSDNLGQAERAAEAGIEPAASPTAGTPTS